MRQIPLRAVLLAILAALTVAASPALAQGAAKKALARGTPPVRTIETDDAPKENGPSQATAEGGFVFVSGQIPLDPKTGELVTGGTEQSVERVFDNLAAVLKA